MPPPKKTRIGAIVLAIQTLKLPEVQEIVTYALSNNMGTNRTPQKIRRTGIDGTTPVHSGISETYTPDFSDNSGTRINGINGTTTLAPIVISGTSATPPACGLWSPRISNIWKSTPQNLRKSDKLNAAVYGKFSNNLIALNNFTKLFIEKLYDSSRSDLYEHCRFHLATDPVNSVEPQFVNPGLSAINALNKGAGILTPGTRIRSNEFRIY